MKRKIWICAVATIAFIASCKKSETNEEQIVSAQKTIVGKWQLVQYFKENTDGTGQWLPTDTSNTQIIKFTADGGFAYNENFVIKQGTNKYKFLEPHKLLMYSSNAEPDSGVKYFYRQDAADELIFNPLCTEFSCMRKWVRIPGN